MRTRTLTRAAAAAAALVAVMAGSAAAAPSAPRPAGTPAAAPAPAGPGVPAVGRAGPAAAYQPQAAGDHVEARLILSPGSPGQWSYQAVGSGVAAVDGVLVNPADYPPGTVWFYRLVVQVPRGAGACFRIYNASAQATVPGSTACVEAPAGYPTPSALWIYDGPPGAVLAKGVNVLQGVRTTGDGVTVRRAELIARWVDGGQPPAVVRLPATGR